MKVIVNGRELTEEESAAHTARMVALHGGLDEMFRTGQAPASKTDKEFLHEHGANGAQFQDTPQMGDYYRRVAESKGQSTKGKVYLSSLAEYPGDPRAWVDGRGDARRVLEERGWGSEGAVKVKAAEATAPPERVPVAADLLEKRVEAMTAADPGLLEKEPGELRHEAAESMKPHWNR